MTETIDSINAAAYKPVRSLQYYETIEISRNGSIESQPHLCLRVQPIFESIGADTSIWNGLNGTNGRKYDFTSVVASPLQCSDVRQLCERYKAITESGISEERIERLAKEVDHQCKVYRCLSNAVTELEIEQKRLKDQLQKDEQDSIDLKVRLAHIHQELTSPRRSSNRIRKTAEDTSKELMECREGKLIQAAILHRIFGEDLCFINDVHGYVQPSVDQISLAKHANTAYNKALKRVWWVKRLYIDLKMGMAYVYNLESKMKSILEHLKDAMDSVEQPFEAIIRGEKTVKYRLDHIRKEWDEVDAQLCSAMPYIQQTSLYIIRLHKNSEVPVKEASSSGLQSPVARVGLFEKQPRLLPSFSRFETLYPLSRRSRITGLYKTAGKAYKELNVLYDCHECLLKKVYERLKMRTTDFECTDKELRAALESILGI